MGDIWVDKHICSNLGSVYFWPWLARCVVCINLHVLFQRVPDAMDDAARIDGAGPFRVFLQIMLPLVKSAISIVFIFSFVWHWNDNYEAPTYMFKQTMLTLQPKLEKYNNIIPN